MSMVPLSLRISACRKLWSSHYHRLRFFFGLNNGLEQAERAARLFTLFVDVETISIFGFLAAVNAVA